MTTVQNSSAVAVKIKRYTISARGDRGLVITLPRVWAEDVGLKKGDHIDVYRDAEDRLIIQAARPEQKEELPLGAGGKGARR